MFGFLGTVLAAAWCCGPFAGEAGASPTTDLAYSVDNGSSWSSDVNAAPGQTVIVRIFVTNDTARAIAGSSVSTAVPSGFTRLSGTTRVCLNPGSTKPLHPSTELACNTDAGQGGPINETSVWTGSDLVISPSAGLLAQSTGQASGPLQIGQKKYLDLVNCDYRRFGDHYTDSITATPNSARLGASTTASNFAVPATRCGPGGAGNVEVGANSATQLIMPLGQRYLRLENCDYRRITDHYTDSISSTSRSARLGAGTAASNSRPTAPSCGLGGLGYVRFAANSGVQSIDLLGNRYLHLENCTFTNGTDRYTSSISTAPSSSSFGAGTSASAVPVPGATCGPGGGGYLPMPLDSGVQNIDLLDTARGQGFVQFRMKAPAPVSSTVYHQTAQLTAGTAHRTGAGTITVNASVSTALGDAGVAVVTVAVVAVFATIQTMRRRTVQLRTRR